METYRASFKSTQRGLDTRLFPMQLWQKAKKLGVWNPSDIDFGQDVKDWQGLGDRERDLLLRLTAQFQAGEESVTYDLLPLLLVMAEEGRIEDESRHIAYGVFLLSRLVAEHGDGLWTIIEATMNTLILTALQHIGQSLLPYGDAIPFGVTAEAFLDFGQAQFMKRYQRIEKARRQTVEEVLYGSIIGR